MVLVLVDYCDRNIFVTHFACLLLVKGTRHVRISRQQCYRCKHQTEFIGNWQVWTECLYKPYHAVLKERLLSSLMEHLISFIHVYPLAVHCVGWGGRIY